MAVRAFCDDCKKDIEEKSRLMIPDIIIIQEDGKIGKASNLHFCNEDGGDAKCLRSWLKKQLNRPMLVTGAGQGGPAQ